MKNLDEDSEEVGFVGTPCYGGAFTLAGDAGAVRFVLPGELIRTDPLTVLEPSPDRVQPGCDHFTVCGGCHLQHAAYPAQLGLKRTVLTDLLDSAGLADLPGIQVESGPEYGYRNRIRLRIQPDAGGQLRAGYSRLGSNEFLPIHMCPIAAPALWQAAESILQLAPTILLIRRWLANTAELELLCGPGEAQLQLQFLLRTAASPDQFSSLCEVVAEDLRARLNLTLIGASATLHPDLNRRARLAFPGATWGAAGLHYAAAGRDYWLPRGAFFQVNRFLIDRLVGIVTGGQQGALAWDLYAGVGLFTRALAESFAHVVAVEGAEPAAAALQALAKQGKGIEPVHRATLDFLRAQSIQRERPDLVVLDPPRAGLGPEAAELLTRIAAPRIVYVSCDPSTLARDLAILQTTYRVANLHLIDLFPQTFHIESIVHLQALN